MENPWVLNQQEEQDSEEDTEEAEDPLLIVGNTEDQEVDRIQNLHQGKLFLKNFFFYLKFFILFI